MPSWDPHMREAPGAGQCQLGPSGVDAEFRSFQLLSLRRMGTHPNCPSTVAGSGQTLDGWLAGHPQALGKGTAEHFHSADLPFLFKVNVHAQLCIHSCSSDGAGSRRLQRSCCHMVSSWQPLQQLCAYSTA